MLIGFVGLREPGNHFKRKVAELFKTKILEFDILSEKLYNTFGGLFGNDHQNVTLTTKSQIKLLLRTELTKIKPSLYMDWMSDQLVDQIFKKEENKSTRIQGIILDVDSAWEYRCVKTYLLSPKYKKQNKIILIDNDSLYNSEYNKNYTDYLEFDPDAVISADDEELERTVDKLVKQWNMETKLCI